MSGSLSLSWRPRPCRYAKYRPICLLSVVYKLFTRVILNTLTRPIEVSPEYKRPLCLTIIDSEKAFDSIEIEAVMEALGSQGVPTQYIKILRELYNNFTTKISPFYNDVNVDVKRGVRQGDTISPKLFTATLQNVMRTLEWDNM
uniref:Reverse transcriptase domain-containing protein n=1 Tax=Angiostrongylus cantonensis TaxID=6313 RepID=A0A0K0D7V0_ANGCA